VQTLFVLCATKWLHRKAVYFEAHEFHGNPERTDLIHVMATSLMRWMLSSLDGLIVITERLKTLYSRLGMPAGAICVAPDGVDARRLCQNLDRREARKALQIPLDKTLVCYTGHLFEWKGVHVLIESGRYLPDGYWIYIVGGTDSDRTALQHYIETRQVKNVVLVGYVPYTEVPGYLAAADVLVLPNTSQQRISREYTSPLKLFEYMGARRPIVASDLPSIREVLCHEEHAFLVPSDDPVRLSEGILRITQDVDLAQRLVENAYAEAQNYTWENRAATIVDFIRSNNAWNLKNSTSS
jgi:glycosyltransferase involved in cell wall biosynthesis